jgi:hypothetical protein
MIRISDSSSSLFPKGIRLEPRLNEGPPSFRPNDVLEGQVLEKIDDHRILIRLAGRSYLAENDIPLSQGDHLLLRIEDTDPKVILNPLLRGGEQDPRVRLLLNTLSGLFLSDPQPVSLSGLQGMADKVFPDEIRKTAEKLLALLARFGLEPAQLDSSEIQERVFRSGVLFEKKISELIETGAGGSWEKLVEEDLKGLVLTLKGEMERVNSSSALLKEDSQPFKKVAENFDQILHKIEGTQVLNLLSAEDRQRVVLSFPLWFQEQVYFADLHISLPHFKKGQSEPEDIGVLILLDMPDWGRLSLEAKMRGENVYGVFRVSNPEVEPFLADNLSRLKDRLAEMGFTPRLDVSVGALEKSSQSLLREWGGVDSLLNVVI